MIKEWSQELKKDADFEFGGQIFRIRYPHWEDMADILNYSLKPLQNGDGEEEGVFEFDYKVDTQYAIDRIPLFIDPEHPTKGAHARFKKVVSDKAAPVPRHQIVQLYRWLVQETGALPTVPPLDSESGGGDSDTSSEEELS